MTVIKTIMLIIVVMGVLVALATVGLKFAYAYVCRLDKRQGEATGGGPTPVGRWLSRHKLIDCLLFFVDENNNRIMDCCVTVTVILGMLTIFLMY